jgi:hypothetical protein
MMLAVYVIKLVEDFKALVGSVFMPRSMEIFRQGELGLCWLRCFNFNIFDLRVLFDDFMLLVLFSHIDLLLNNNFRSLLCLGRGLILLYRGLGR